MHRFVPLLIALAVVVISSFAEEKTKDADLLIKDLKDSNPLVQHSAALALGEIKDDRAIEPLIQALKSRCRCQTSWDYFVCWQAKVDEASTFGIINGTRAVDQLIQVLKDNDSDVRAAAALALADIKDARAVEPLIQALKDNETNVRAVAAFALSRIGKPSIDPLLLALMDNDSDIRAGASLAIGMINDTRAIEQSKLIGAGTNKGESLLRIASGSNGIIPSGIAALQDPAGL